MDDHKRYKVGEDSVAVEGPGYEGLHYGPKDSARMAAHLVEALSRLPKPTVRERIADWLEGLAYRIRNGQP